MNKTIVSGGYKVVINAHGAELASFKDESGKEYMWQAEPSVWARHAPVLFPFVCSTDSKKFTVKGTEYKMSNHGFARDSEFDIAKETENSVTYILRSTEETKKLYPYDFEFSVTYTLEGNKLTCTFSPENKGSEDMYFFVGGHPAFNCPLSEDERFDDYIVKYEKPETVVQELPNGRKIVVADNTDTVKLSREVFANDVFMKTNPESSSVSLIGTKSGKGVKVSYDNKGTIAVWSANNENAGFVCLEPWDSVPVYIDRTEELTEMPHAVKLSAGSSYDFSFTIEIF